jgi:hypothetical protein
MKSHVEELQELKDLVYYMLRFGYYGWDYKGWWGGGVWNVSQFVPLLKKKTLGIRKVLCTFEIVCFALRLKVWVLRLMIYSLGQNGMPPKFCWNIVKVMKFCQIYVQIIKSCRIMPIYDFFPKLCQSYEVMPKFCRSYVEVLPSYAQVMPK